MQHGQGRWHVRRIAVTGSGETFLVHARRLLQLQRKAITALGRSQPVTLRLDSEDYADTWLLAPLERFGAQQPVHVHIHCRMRRVEAG